MTVLRLHGGVGLDLSRSCDDDIATIAAAGKAALAAGPSALDVAKAVLGLLEQAGPDIAGHGAFSRQGWLCVPGCGCQPIGRQLAWRQTGLSHNGR